MQYIERIFSSAKRMYSDINSATLCGAIDVIVVKYPNGEFVSSPFYVQFGKTGVLRPCADEVEVTINGVLRTDIVMRVNRYGQAYFDDPDAPDDDSRPCSPNLDSGINLDFQLGQSPPITDTYFSSKLPNTADKTRNHEPSIPNAKQDLLNSVPTLLQCSDFSEFESNMQWWNQGNTASKSIQIQTYRLTDEQSKAADPNAKSANDSVWVYWENKWYSWRTANIKLRFLRNLGTPLSPYYKVLQSKLMDLDRENPAFVLLPNAPPQLVDVKKQETGHFNWDHLENLEASLKPSQDDEDENGVEFRGEHALSFPGTPQSPKMNELDYFSDGHSPKNYEEMDNLNWRFKCQWAQSHNTSAFKLSSGDIKRLDLDNGTNEAVFTTINKYQGTCTCYCLIYLWNFTDKIVISDIDGTITKSDLLGHVMHWVGLEWTHPGVVQLYKKIDDNGYRLMYLSARCIGQANPTRNFLEGIEQDKEKLPAGPIILSPNSLITTINMEIIQKRPQVLKIANLKRLGELFRQQNPEAPCPFYAGFGNRVSDTETYRAIGIPDSRIFIVNPLGVIETPTGLKLSSGYTSLCEVVDSVFPPEYQKLSDGIGHSDFTFWRKEFPSETNS